MGASQITTFKHNEYGFFSSCRRWQEKIILKYELQPQPSQSISTEAYLNNFTIYRSTDTSVEKDHHTYSKQYIIKYVHVPQCTELCSILKNFSQNKKQSYILNLIESAEFNEGNFCNSSHTVIGLFEYYGDHTLQEQIHRRGGSKIEKNYFSISQLVKVYRFVVNVVNEIKDQKDLWFPIISATDILLDEESSNLKYKNLIDSSFFERNEKNYYFCPENWGRGKEQSQTIFSFGMTMISMCLLKDLSDCYDLKNTQLCLSLLEEKIDELRNLQSTELWSSFCDIIESMVQPKSSNRPSLNQCSSMCNEFLSKMRKQETERTQLLSDISTTYNHNIICQTHNPKTQRSLHKNTHQLSNKKISCDLSSGKSYKRSTWDIQSSEKKQLKINGSLNKKIFAWKHSNNQKQNPILIRERNFDEIDRKWKEDEFFEKMPQFDEIDLSFHFQLDSKILDRIEGSLHPNSLKSYR